MNERVLAALCVLCCSLFALSTTSGCSLKKQAPVKLRYLVEAKRPGDSAVASSQAVLRVRSLRIASPFEGRGFVYRKSEENYETDFYHEFLVAPQAMLTEQVRQWLDTSGRFRAVVDPASKLDSTLSLEGNVTAFYGDFRSKATPKAVLEVHFLLLDDQSSAPQVAFQKSFRQEIDLESRSPESLVAGWGKALLATLTQLERDLPEARAR